MAMKTAAGTGRYAWITTAFDHSAVLEAIVLSHSMTRVATMADKIVFVADGLEDSLLDQLGKAFDVVLPVSSVGISLKNIKESEEYYALLYSWSFTMYDKCVFLHPNSLILRSCDELFLMDEISTVQFEGCGDKFVTSIVVLKPCFKTYRKMTNMALSQSPNNSSDLLNLVFSNGELQWRNTLPRDYSYSVTSSKTVDDKRNLDTAKIAHFGTTKPWHTLAEPRIRKCHEKGDDDDDKLYLNDILEKAWMNIFDSEVRNELDAPSIRALGLNESFFHCEITTEKRISRCHDPYKNAIAIVGHSCRLPGANTSDEFWDLLVNGGDGISDVPRERLFDCLQDDPRFTKSRGGFLKCPVDEFDAKFFGISSREADFMDPQQRLLVEVSWEALENAAINPYSLKGSNTAVFSGVWTHDYEKIANETATSDDFHHVVLGNSFSATSARISYLLGLNGPNVATESGCSSSMVSLHLACDSLRKKETDLALVLGANILIIHFPLNEIPILAKDGRCKTFDEKADGFGRAEGVVVVALKRYSDALKNGDRIMGLIQGSALSNEGTTSSFGTPSKYCQEIAVKAALKNAGVNPSDVDYVEAHGTGTPIGDPIEIAAISSGYKGQRENPLIIGSVKTNIGHTESAAGLAGLLKVLLAMKHETIPRHINFDILDPNIDLAALPAVIPTENVAWLKNESRVRRAGISSFGISGTNVHVIVQEPPNSVIQKDLIPNSLEDKSYHCLTLSAKSENALADLGNKYIKYIEENPTVNIKDLVFTANTGRAHLKYRACVTGATVHDLKEEIKNKNLISKSLSKKPKVAFLFTGHGSAYPKMARELYTSCRVFRNAFDDCLNTLDNNYEVSLRNVLWDEKYHHLLVSSIYSQAAVFSVGYSLSKMWRSFGVEPEFISGHSAGESAAGAAAGAISLKDALALVSGLASLVDKHLPDGAMLAIRAKVGKVTQMISNFFEGKGLTEEEWLDVAVVNSPQQVIVSGPRNTVKIFSAFCLESGTTCQLLPGRYAFHSRAMQVLVPQYRELTKKLFYLPPKCSYVSGRTGKIVGPYEMDGEYLVENMLQPVQYPTAAKTLVENGCNVFIEMGATPILLTLCMASTNPSENVLWLPSMRKNENNWKTVLESVGKLYANGYDINWSAVDSPLGRNKLELPTYPFQKQKYWLNFKSKNGSSLLHPLMGVKISLANTQNTFYEHTWNVRDLAYLQDHQVANVIILPAAGFLEMFLFVGNHTVLQKLGVKKEDVLVKVEDFVVVSPLELLQDKQCQVQMLVSPVDGSPNSVIASVFVFENLNGYNEEKGWKKYASASVSIQDKFGEIQNSKIDSITDLKLRCSTYYSAEDLYKAVSDVGIFLGESFQSIRQVWKGDNEVLAEIALPSNVGNTGDYIMHPIILDAIVQTFGVSICQESADLYLPVGVDKFSLVSTANSEMLYAHAIWESGTTSGIVKLYDEKNILVAEMKGLHLVKTSVSSFLNVINSQNNMLPGMYQGLLRIRDGHAQGRFDLFDIPNVNSFPEDWNKDTESPVVNNLATPIKDLANEMISLEIIEMFLKVGLDATPGAVFSTSFLLKLIKVDCNPKLISRFLEILCEDGYLQLRSQKVQFLREWEVLKSFSSFEQLSRRKNQIRTQINEIEKSTSYSDNLYRMALNCAQNLENKFHEKPSMLMEDQTIERNKVFSSSSDFELANLRISKFLQLAFSQLKSKEKHSGSFVRILEVGAGSGSTTKTIFNAFTQAGIPFRYTFTDKQSDVLAEAKIKFSGISGIEYRILNVEDDPIYQRFIPFHYDVVIAANVIHSTKDLLASLKNVRNLIRNGGYFILQELSGPQRAYDMMFGLSDDYWRFDDSYLRGDHPCVVPQLWENILPDCKLNNSTIVSEKDEIVHVIISRATDNIKIEKAISGNEKRSGWILYGDDDDVIRNVGRKLDSIGRIVHILQYSGKHNSEKVDPCYQYHGIDVLDSEKMNNCLNSICDQFNIEGICYLRIRDNDIDQRDICLPLLHICQNVIKYSRIKTGVYSVIRGSYFVGDQKTVNPATATTIGMIKTFSLEFPPGLCKLIDLDPESMDTESDSVEIFSELLSSDDPITVFRNKKKHVFRLTALQKPIAPITLPQGRYSIAIPSSKQLNDVSFRPVTKIGLGPNEIEVEVKAVALNFRDVFVIIKPEQYHTLFEAVGTDFSGIISGIGQSVTKYKIGEKVFGMSNTSSAASHVVVNENMVLPKPENFTHAEGSTLPSVFLTAYYCLYNVAKLKKGETILIHVASGGVGLVAIQLANLIGAKIIATAGSKRKRNYLRSIGIKNVFHSRDLSFGEEIEKVTNGTGVDVVLNSLTSVGFKETSLKICSPCARFVEMGKVNIWEPEEVQKLRQDVKYTIVDVEKTTEEDMMKLLESMKAIIQDGLITPLPYSRFEITQIKEGLNYFLKAQHIGKVVLCMPEIKESQGRKFTNELIFNDSSTYLITGGFGGIGLEVVKWMSDCGAKYLVVVGRNPPDEKAKQVINKLDSIGCHLTAMQVDVGVWSECKILFDFMASSESKLPPLKGVIHSAGSLSDGVLTSQNWGKFETVFNAKVSGGWNLHNLTKSMALEHFVLFSSVAGSLGNSGQSNHSAANSFLDSLAAHRYSLGLPAQTIQWGAWSSIGAASNTTFGREGQFGFRPFSPSQGIAALKFIMTRPNLTEVAVAQMNVKLIKENFLDKGNVFSELDNGAEEAPLNEKSAAASEKFWNEINPMGVDDRAVYIKKYLERIIRRTLRLPETEQIDEHQALSDMGLDSLMAIETKNKLQNIFGRNLVISTNSLLDYPTIYGLSTFLAKETMNVTIVEKTGTNDTVFELVKQDSLLPQDIQCVGLAPPKKRSEISNVLLTGATGCLGAYVLNELLGNPKLNVFCLIRGKNIEQAKKKLIYNLRKYNLKNCISDLDRVSIILGNIVEDQLGLLHEVYEDLSSKIDLIFHFAAKANHIEQYKQSKSKVDIRSVNVLGTLNILRLASNIKVKEVHFSSSYTTANRLTNDGFAVEDFPAEDNYGKELKMGYVLTKFVCEKLLKEAIARGIPCTVIRYPTLGGHSETGLFVPGSSTFINILLLSVHLGVIPESRITWYSISVDVAARLASKLALSDRAVSGLYHINLADPITKADVMEVTTRCGYPLKPVTDDEYRKLFLQESEGNALFSYFAESYGTDLISVIRDVNPVLTEALKSENNIYRHSDKLLMAIPDLQDIVGNLHSNKVLVSKYLNYAGGAGILTKS